MLYHFSDQGLPFSLIFFAIALGVFLLQLFPYTGIFLMMVMAPLWSAVLLNLGFLGLGIEALTGRVPIAWLLAPALWYGLYALFAVQEEIRLRAEMARVKAVNSGLRVRFDPNAHDILVEPAPEGRGGQLASGLLHFHDIAVVYTTGDRVNVEGTRAHRLLDARTATELAPRSELSAAGVDTRPVPLPRGRSWETSRSLKGIVYPEEPSRPLLRVTPLPTERARRGTLPIAYASVDLLSPGETGPQRLVTGTAAPLHWLPMLAAGCALDSGTPAWRCFAGFLRRRPVPLMPGTGAYGSVHFSVGEVLGLARLAPEDHQPGDPAPVRRQVEKIEAAAVAVELDHLGMMIEDPLVKPWRHSFDLLRRRPQLIAPHAEAMVRAMAVAHLERSGPHCGSELAGLLYHVDDDKWQALKPRVLAFYAPPFEEKDWRTKTDRLLARLGEYGPDALPIVMRGFHERRGRPHAHGWALQAICRMGPAARSAAGEKVLEIWRARYSPPEPLRDDIDRWVYLALLRMGMKAEAGRVTQFYYGKWFEAAFATVTPDSPPEPCSIR
jgi:hypothetical protein